MKASAGAAETAEASPDDLSGQMGALRADLAKLASTLSALRGEEFEESGRGRGRTTRDVRRKAADMVADHPVAAVGIAVGVGLLLGVIARRI